MGRTTRTWAHIVGLALVITLVAPAEQSQAAADCEIPQLTWTHTEANDPLLAPGTKISFTSQCLGASEAPFRVELSDAGGGKLFFLEGITAGSGDLTSATDIFIPIRGAEVCVSVGGTEVCKRFSLGPGSGPDSNTPPHASFEASCEDLTCRFTDTSSDPDLGGSIQARSWDLDADDSVDSHEQELTHTYPSAGTHEVRLEVTDERGATTSITKQVTVNSPPAASFEVQCQAQACSFSDTSVDKGGSVSSWAWDFDGDGTVDSDRAAATHDYPAVGTYDVSLTVTDDANATDSATRTITVYSPLAVETTALPRATKKVMYSSSLQASGGKPAYGWTLISGSLPSGISLASDGTLSGTPKSPGSYPITVQVSDQQTPAATATRSFTLVVASR